MLDERAYLSCYCGGAILTVQPTNQPFLPPVNHHRKIFALKTINIKCRHLYYRNYVINSDTNEFGGGVDDIENMYANNTLDGRTE